MASRVTETVKKMPAVQESWVWSLGWEDLLEKDMATHSSILALKIPMDRRARWATWGHKESDMTERLSTQQMQSFKIIETNFLKINKIWISIKPCVHDYVYICVDVYMYICSIFMEWSYMSMYMYYMFVC